MQNVSFLAGCDMVVSGFAQIQAQLQYRASGCSIGLPVVVGTSRGVGVEVPKSRFYYDCSEPRAPAGRA